MLKYIMGVVVALLLLPSVSEAQVIGGGKGRMPRFATPPTCNNARSGSIYYDTDTNSFLGCDGTSWGALDVVGSIGTANTIAKFNSGATDFADSLLADNGTDVTLSTGAEFRLDDGSATDDAVVFGASQDAAIFYNASQTSLDIDAQAGSAGDQIRLIGGAGGFGADPVLQVITEANEIRFSVNDEPAAGDSFAGGLIQFGHASGLTLEAMNGSDTVAIAAVALGTMGNHTGTGNTLNMFLLPAITGDAELNLHAINIGALTGTAGSDNEVESAITIGTGWDYGLSILDDGSATLSNITLGDSRTADAQIYFDSANLVFDLNGTGGNGVSFVIDGAASASDDMIVLTSTIGLMNGSDTQRGLHLSMTNANHTSTSNNVNIFEIAAITGDAESNLNAILIGALTGTAPSSGEVETAINIGAGWDTGVNQAGSGATSTVLGASFDAAVEFNSYRQDFDSSCHRANNNWGAVGNADGDINRVICGGAISTFHYRLEGAQGDPVNPPNGTGLDIDNDGTDNEGVEIVLSDSAVGNGWIIVGTSPAMYARFNVTITSVSGTDNFFVGWRTNTGYQDNIVVASYDTYAVHLINDTVGNLVIQTGDDTVDGTDENAVNAVWADAETITFEVQIATDGTVTFYTDGVVNSETNATGGFDAGDIAYPFFGLLNAADADTDATINWIEVGEVI